jgi:uncharacterized protein with HEPN domain
VALAQGRTREDLDDDRLYNLAMTRLLEIIGEAANRVSDDVQAQYPELPWLQMVGLRNRLMDGYDNVDFDILFTILQINLPELIAKLEKIRGL